MTLAPDDAQLGSAFQDQMGPNFCFGCGPDNPDGLQIKSYWAADLEGQVSVCWYRPRPEQAAGPRHVLNGGIVATLIDCHSICTAAAHAYWAEERSIGSEPGLWYVTGALEIKYLRPTPLTSSVELRATIKRAQDKRTEVECALATDGKERATATVTAIRVPLDWLGRQQEEPK